MREILFKGKRTNNNEWIYGNLIHTKKEDLDYYEIITLDGLQSSTVKTETVRQFTGLTDRNGKKIFEGDIVKTKEFGKRGKNGVNYNNFDIFEVIYSSAAFVVNNSNRMFHMLKGEKYEIIGNRWDNPELLQAVK